MPKNHEADICNPTSEAYQKALDNHSNLLNPNNENYQGD